MIRIPGVNIEPPKYDGLVQAEGARGVQQPVVAVEARGVAAVGGGDAAHRLLRGGEERVVACVVQHLQLLQ